MSDDREWFTCPYCDNPTTMEIDDSPDLRAINEAIEHYSALLEATRARRSKKTESRSRKGKAVSRWAKVVWKLEAIRAKHSSSPDPMTTTKQTTIGGK